MTLDKTCSWELFFKVRKQNKPTLPLYPFDAAEKGFPRERSEINGSTDY